MGTVSKEIADDIIAGKYAAEDGMPVRIVEYTNAWGGISYGVEHYPHELGKYHASQYIHNPRVYWEAKDE
jgi:hypothetical protein